MSGYLGIEVCDEKPFIFWTFLVVVLMKGAKWVFPITNYENY